MLRIVHYPHPALRYTSRPVTKINDDLRAVVKEMFSLMYEARGIGLAANQVGLPYRFFVLNLTADPEQSDKELVFINPVIMKRHSSGEDEEGCLSLPGLYGKVRRAKKIKVQAFNLEGALVEYQVEDLFARAIQHETEHLDGKLFIDDLGPLSRYSIKEKLREFENAYQALQSSGEIESDEKIVADLDAMTGPCLPVSAPSVDSPLGQ